MENEEDYIKRIKREVVIHSFNIAQNVAQLILMLTFLYLMLGGALGWLDVSIAVNITQPKP